MTTTTTTLNQETQIFISLSCPFYHFAYNVENSNLLGLTNRCIKKNINLFTYSHTQVDSSFFFFYFMTANIKTLLVVMMLQEHRNINDEE